MRNIDHHFTTRALVLFTLIVLMVVPSAASTIVNMAPHQPSPGPTWKDILLTLSAVLSPIVALAALFMSAWNTKAQLRASEANANAQRWQDANQKEIEQLEKLLHDFHVPYLVRAEANNNMAQDLRQRFANPNYRMLISLFTPNWLNGLSPGDRALVDEVCTTGADLREFIEERSGNVDSGLADHLARASTHFRILSLAHDGRLGTDAGPFERYVYPRQLDLAIMLDRQRIEERIAQLRARPSESHGAIEPLRLPKEAQLDPWPAPHRQ